MNALNRLDIRREECRVVHLVFEENTCHLVSNELCWLNLVVLLVQVVVLETPRENGELQVSPVNWLARLAYYIALINSPCFEVPVTNNPAPHLEGKDGHHVF